MPTFSETSPHDHRTALNSVAACTKGAQLLLDAQTLFSFAVFGLPDFRGPAAVLDHVRKEVEEIALAPMDAQEWADLVLLALDGLRRSCWLHNAQFVATDTENIGVPMSARVVLTDKMRRNFGREWPALADQHPDRAVEHVRTPDEQAVKDSELIDVGFSMLGGRPPLVRPEFTARPTCGPIQPPTPNHHATLHAWAQQLRTIAPHYGYANASEMLTDAGLIAPPAPKVYDVEKCIDGVVAHFGLQDGKELSTAILRHHSGGWDARDEAFRLQLTLNPAVQLAGYENLTHFTLSALANLGHVVPSVETAR